MCHNAPRITATDTQNVVTPSTDIILNSFTSSIGAEKIFKKVIKKEDLNYIRIHEYARSMAKTKIPTPNERREFMYSLMDDKNLKQNLKAGKLGDAKTRIKVLFDLWVKPYGVYANSN